MWDAASGAASRAVFMTILYILCLLHADNIKSGLRISVSMQRGWIGWTGPCLLTPTPFEQHLMRKGVSPRSGKPPYMAGPPLGDHLAAAAQPEDQRLVQALPYLHGAAELMSATSCGEAWLLQPRIEAFSDLEYRRVCFACTTLSSS